MGDWDFQGDIDRHVEARRIALTILELKEGASREEIKRAFRRAALASHPDRNPDDPEAERRFIAALHAYAYLSGDTSVEATLRGMKTGAHQAEKGTGYDLSNDWGFFLWWRDRYF